MLFAEKLTLPQKLLSCLLLKYCLLMLFSYTTKVIPSSLSINDSIYHLIRYTWAIKSVSALLAIKVARTCYKRLQDPLTAN